jgi:hypothetical protein
MPKDLPTGAEKGRKTAGGGADPRPPGGGRRYFQRRAALRGEEGAAFPAIRKKKIPHFLPLKWFRKRSKWNGFSFHYMARKKYLEIKFKSGSEKATLIF